MNRFSRFADPTTSRFARNPPPLQQSDSFFQCTPWLELRYRILKASKGCCECCGRRGEPGNPLQVDHIKPRSKFPDLALRDDNCQVLCRQCNLGKSNKDATDWRFEPSRELTILQEVEPSKRFRLQQLGWLKMNGEGKQIRSEATREYRRLWREIEADWIATKQAAQ